MPNETRGRLDSAIDRAVRGMMQVDPAPGLRVRVAGRLERAPSRVAFPFSFASAAALIVIVVASVALFRAMRSVGPTEPAVGIAPAAQVTTVQPKDDVAAPAPRTAAPPVAPSAGRVRAIAPVGALPRPSVIFSGPRDGVRAASVAGEAASDIGDPPAPPLPDMFVPLSPIVIVPISITPIVVHPLTVPPLSDRK